MSWQAAGALAVVAGMPALLTLWAAGQATGLAGSAATEPLPILHLLWLMGNSFAVAAGGALGALAWGALPGAVAARSQPGPLRSLTLAGALLPLLLPPAIVAVVATHLLGGTGWLTVWWRGDAATPAAAPVFSLPGVAFCLAWMGTPLGALAWWLGLRARDAELEDAARLEGGAVAVARHALWPAAAPVLGAMALVLVLLGLMEFSIPEALRAQPVLVREVYGRFSISYDFRGALLLAAALMGPAVLLAVPLLRRGGTLASSVTVSAPPRGAPGWMQGVALLMAWTPTAVAVAVLALTMTGPQGVLSAIAQAWTVAWREFLWTLLLAAVGATLAVLVGAWLGTLAMGRGGAAVGLAMGLAFLTPGPIAGVVLKLALLGGPDQPAAVEAVLLALDDSWAPLLAVWTWRFAAVTGFLVAVRLRQVPREWREAQALEGGGWLGAWRAWGLAWLGHPLLTGWLVSFALILGEAGAAVLLVPPGTTTLPVRLLTLMHYAPTAQVSGLCLLMLAPCLIATGLALVVQRRARFA